MKLAILVSILVSSVIAQSCGGRRQPACNCETYKKDYCDGDELCGTHYYIATGELLDDVGVCTLECDVFTMDTYVANTDVS